MLPALDKYGSPPLAPCFLADDTRNKRSVLSYLRGAQKDGTANREDKDFCSQIVLEIQDTGSGAKTCVGVAFEVARGDQDVNKYCFFFR